MEQLLLKIIISIFYLLVTSTVKADNTFGSTLVRLVILSTPSA